MMTDRRDTIFALASGPGRAAIAVIRISGPQTGAVLHALAAGRVPPPRHAGLRSLRDPRDGEALDEAIVLWMPGPASFTGEDSAELHVHGGLAVRSAVIRALARHPGCRDAEPGEFTRRAFLSGRMDLSAVEGLADLIDAETDAQRRQALRQLDGALWHHVEAWRGRLLQAASLLEAGLDFSDEEDVPEDLRREVDAGIAGVAAEVAHALSLADAGERLRDGFVVVIAGPANAGKSTLLNALARRDAAIVSPHPGTTRDAIEIRCDLRGLPVTFVDTAGLRDTVDPVEQEGVALARRRAREADLVLWLQAPDVPDPERPSARRLLPVRTKGDLQAGIDGTLVVSARTGAGLDALVERVRREAEAGFTGAADAVVTRERHRLALTDVGDALGRAADVLAAGREELAAEDLRLALRALGRITGTVDVEEILDRVFAQFCIGK